MIIFHGDCPTSRDEKEIEQFQQMLNWGDEQTQYQTHKVIPVQKKI